MCVVQHAPHLQQHIHEIAIEERLYATMRCIGVIIEVGFNMEVDGLTSTRTFRDWHRHTTNTYINPRCLSRDAIGALNRLFVDQEGQDVLGIDVSESHGKIMSTEEVHTGKCTDRSIEVFERDLPCSVQQRHWPRPNAVHTNTDNDVERVVLGTSRSIFVASNSVLGITSSPTRCGDMVCIFPDGNNDKTAMIVRPPKHYGQLRTIGTALYHAHASDTDTDSDTTTLQPECYGAERCRLGRLYLLYTPKMDDPVYDYRRSGRQYVGAGDVQGPGIHTLKWAGRRFAYFLPPQGNLLNSIIRFYCHPLCLPSLAQHRILQYYFVPQRIEMTMEAQQQCAITQHTAAFNHSNSLHSDGDLGKDELRKAKAIWAENEVEKDQSVMVRKWISTPFTSNSMESSISDHFLGGSPGFRSDLPGPPLGSDGYRTREPNSTDERQ
jgi:hypothetical protein